MWDGDWYRRAYYDGGETLGSKWDDECKIDAIAQSWSVLSGGGNATHSHRAMHAVYERPIRPHDRLSLLFTPPDKTPLDPGYIKGYIPDSRKRGPVHTCCHMDGLGVRQMGDGNRAFELFNLLNPIYQADSYDKASVYRVEPYDLCRYI